MCTSKISYIIICSTMTTVTFRVEIDVFGVRVFCEGKSLNRSAHTSFWRFKTGGGGDCTPRG